MPNIVSYNTACHRYISLELLSNVLTIDSFRMPEYVSQALGKSQKRLGLDPSLVPLGTFRELEKSLGDHVIIPVLKSPLVRTIIPVLKSPLVRMMQRCMYILKRKYKQEIHAAVHVHLEAQERASDQLIAISFVTNSMMCVTFLSEDAVLAATEGLRRVLAWSDNH